MNPRVDTANRLALTLLGVLLLVTGGLGLALSFRAFGNTPPLLPRGMRDFARDQPWFWWAVAAACLLVALLALWWLIAQLRVDRATRLDLTTDDRDGLTVVHSSALTDAVENEAEALRGVGGASAQLREVRGRRLSLAVELTDYADIAQVRQALEDEIVGHARQAVGDPDLPVDIELRPGTSRSGGRGLR